MLWGVAKRGEAANLTTTTVQAAGQDWIVAIWKTNGTGAAVSPKAGNTYQTLFNGTSIGNGANSTRIRNPATAGLQTFPGDWLKMDTNTELRAKQPGAILNFPGVDGNPGLILNGGMLNGGDDTTFPVSGVIQVVAQSYVSQGLNGGGGGINANRAFNFTGVLSGSGNIVILNAGTTVPQQVSGSFNSFSGQWIVQCGWLQASGANSLGTNSITVDPLYSGYLSVMPNFQAASGPAWFEPNYDLYSAGSLTLTNSGVMILHQNCVFSAVRIEGAALSAGMHSYAELATNFPGNFTTNGSGSLTVQPYGRPVVTGQPASVNLMAGSATQLVATASGAAPFAYQWQKGTNGTFTNVVDHGDMIGSRSNVLSFSAVANSDLGDYRLIVTNSLGTATSQVATVTVAAALGVAAEIPAAGSTVSNLLQIQVTFNRNVTFVGAADLLINGQPANAVSPTLGGGSNYTFTFTQPAPGPIAIGWDAGQSISDLAGTPFDSTAPGATWSYTLLDTVPPAVGELAPGDGTTVSHLTQVAVTFTKAVLGVHASALLINGHAATNVTGSGSGPYLFQFPQPANGAVQFAWIASNGITDTTSPPNAFAGGSWSVTLNPAAGPPTVRINEFLASNISSNGLVDQFGNLDPWIELYNFGSNDVNLAGYSLTDDPAVPDKWVFPAVLLPAGQFLVVFADGLNVTSGGGAAPLHTSFSLTAAGAYLGLYDDESPRLALTEFAPAYPLQRNDYSYGYDGANQLKYFAVPTPDAPNGLSSITGVVADVHFTVQRGFFNQPFTLLLTCPTRGATIRYTTDGSQPTELTTGATYTNALWIDHLTVVRAAAFLTNSLPSLVQTHSYLFLSNVLNQPSNPPGFPITTGWSINGWPSEYGMNQLVVTNPLYAPEIQNDLIAIPTLSIAVKTDEMFGPAGIYTNSPAGTTRPEIACSVELICPDRTPGFQTDCGIKIHGGGSAEKPMKKPLALKFQSSFGPGSLRYRFFSDSPVDKFTGGFVLRADYNNSWVHALTPYGAASIAQRARGDLVRDAMYKDLQLAMGDLSSHSRYVHLYINGLYWGVYNPCEDVDRHFAASYLGGSPDDYDSVKGSDNALAVDGDMVAYNLMLSFNTAGLANLAQYNQIQQYLDVKQYADYMLLQFYGANQDWATAQNWVAVHNKKVPGALWEYLCWDDERILEGVNDTPVGSALNSVSPSNLQANLVRNAEYRLLFADRTYKFLFNNGILTTNGIVPFWLTRASQIYQAIVGESARWGNSVPGGKLALTPLPYPSYDANTPYYSRNENFLGEQGRLFTNYFPFRTAVVLSQLRSVGLYPAVDAPVFSQFGGNVPFGFKLAITAKAGTIYFTTNGVDPRVYGTSAVSPQAFAYSNSLTLTLSSVVRARALSGGVWSALAEGTFTVASLGVPLCITEIMYNPPGGPAYTYVNVQNIGATPLDVSGFDFQGIGYTFPSGTILQPGQVLLLASKTNPAAFAARYPGAKVFDYFGGTLASGGERLAILDRMGRTVTAVTYDNANGWPKQTDGGGYSLQLIDPNGDPNSPANWRASTLLNGRPGLPLVTPPVGNILLNEIMASNVSAVQNGTNFPDWLELHNSSSNTVDLANWSLSNSGNTRKYVFPANTPLGADGYLVVWSDSATNDPGLHSGFHLTRSGDKVFLYDANTNRVDAVSFGQQVTDMSLGRISGQWQLTLPTPGAGNAAAPLDAITNISINEWMAYPLPGTTSWIELFNCSSNAPVALRGLYLAATNSLFQVRTFAFLPPRGFLQCFAEQSPGPANVDLSLPASGSAIMLYDPAGIAFDSVTYGPQTLGVSQGSLPDGSTNIVSFPASSSPGANNYVLNWAGPALNEVLARNLQSGLSPWGSSADWIELYNPSNAVVDISGFALSKPGGSQWSFPIGTSMPSNGYLRVWCDGSYPASVTNTFALNTGFSLGASSDTVFLFNNLGQTVDSISFGFQVPDLSIGRSGGTWLLLAAPTPGAANAAPAALGDPSALRINEWLAAPLASSSWFELYNTSALPVDMTGLYLTDTPTIEGVTNLQVAPLSFIGGRQWVKWVADHDLSQGDNHVSFRLDPLGETIRLYSANLALIDSVDYGIQTNGVSQGRFPDGGSNLYFMPTPTPAAANILTTNPPVRFGSVGLDGTGRINFTFDSAPGQSYQLEYKNSLGDPQWTPLGSSVPGTGGTLTLNDSMTADPQRFYRLVVSQN
jgi:hypothetical protein